MIKAINVSLAFVKGSFAKKYFVSFLRSCHWQSSSNRHSK
jgi:hypothetical protein